MTDLETSLVIGRIVDLITELGEIQTTQNNLLSSVMNSFQELLEVQKESIIDLESKADLKDQMDEDNYRDREYE